MLIGVDASRVTRPQRTGTENYSLHVLRNLLEQDDHNTYRLYASRAIGPHLLPITPRVSQRVIRLRRLWTQVGLSREMLVTPPDVLFVPSHVLPLICPQRSVVVIYDVGHRFFPRAHTVPEWLYVEWAIRRRAAGRGAADDLRPANATWCAIQADRRIAVAYRSSPPFSQQRPRKSPPCAAN